MWPGLISLNLKMKKRWIKMKIEKKDPKKVVAFKDVLAGTAFKGATGSLVYFSDPIEKVEILKDAVLTY